MKLLFFVFIFPIYCIFGAVNSTADYSEKCEANCTFSEEFITSQNLRTFPTNCSVVCANIVVNQNTNVSEKQLTVAFKNMKTLYGSLKVQSTNLTSGKFLEGLEAIECDPDGSFTWEDNSHLTVIGMTNLSRCACNIDINFNVLQTRLNLPNLKNFLTVSSNTSQFTVSINSMPSEFCISTDEMEVFMTNENVDIQFEDIDYCNSTTKDKLCLTDRFSFEKLESGCTRILGYIKITNALEADTEKLRTVKWIFGTLDIDSTVLVSIDFLDNLEYVVSLARSYYAIKIDNNKKLKNISIPNIKRVKANYERWIEFYDNPENLTNLILKNTPFCNKKDEAYYDKTRIDDKTCDPKCIFNEESISSENVQVFPKNCITICGYIQIDEHSKLSEYQLYSVFKNMKTLYGSLRVYRTKFTNLKFLAGLETIECDESLSFTVEENEELTELGMVNLTRCACEVLINVNHNMMKLNLPNLKNFSSATGDQSQHEMYISNLQPNACIDIQEMENFIINRNLFMRKLSGKYCYTESKEKVCVSENGSLWQLDSDCVDIIGDIVVERGDEHLVHKLKSLRIMFGKIKISNTNLTKVDFLNRLEYLATLEDNVDTIEIARNENLTEFLLPSLKWVRSKASFWFRVLERKEMSEFIMRQPQLCTSFRDIHNKTVLYSTSIGGISCEVLREEALEDALNPNNFELACRGFGSLLAVVVIFSFKSLQ